jgi:GDP-4-dehydro-6-deoxy-D-mannose reductase
LTPISNVFESVHEGPFSMRVSVTGADGFVGRHLVRRLVETGHEVTAGCRPGGEPVARWLGERWSGAVHLKSFELADASSVDEFISAPLDAIVHLAAMASGSEARDNPAGAWMTNAVGTARVVDAAVRLRAAEAADPLLVVVSTAEVYGKGKSTPRLERDPVCPQSPYAASKAGAELAGLEAWRRTGLRVVIVRPFPHTGKGQPSQYVVPAFIDRLRAAKKTGISQVATGNLDPVRDLLDVRDVAEAYLGILANGTPGETYNIARGEGVSLRQLFQQLTELMEVKAEPAPNPSLVRTADIPHLVGDGSKLRKATGWSPTVSLEQTLRDMLDAQAH